MATTFHPRSPVVSAAEADHPRLRHLRIRGAELRLRIVVGDEVAREDVASIDQIVVLDPPRPAGVHRLGGGERVVGVVGTTPSADHGPIARQGLLEVDERLPEGGPQQFGTESGAVDEEIGGHGATVVEPDRLDATLPDLHLFDDRIHGTDSVFRDPAFEEIDEAPVLEVVGEPRTLDGVAVRTGDGDIPVVHQRSGETRESRILATEIADGLAELGLDRVRGGELRRERIVVRGLGAPVELDPELDARKDLLVESKRLDPQVVVQEPSDRRDGALTDTDDPDLGRSDHHDLDIGQVPGEGRRGEQGRTSTAEDDHLPDAVVPILSLWVVRVLRHRG